MLIHGEFIAVAFQNAERMELPEGFEGVQRVGSNTDSAMLLLSHDPGQHSEIPSFNGTGASLLLDAPTQSRWKPGA